MLSAHRREGEKAPKLGYIKPHLVHNKGTLREINRYYICLFGPLHVPSRTQVCHLTRLLVFIRVEYLCVCVGCFPPLPLSYYDVIQAWWRHSAAVALFSGIKSSMGRRKLLKHCASSLCHSYFSTRTSRSPHGFSFVMCLSSPA